MLGKSVPKSRQTLSAKADVIGYLVWYHWPVGSYLANFFPGGAVHGAHTHETTFQTATSSSESLRQQS
jgi:hypothetical protein